MNKVIYRIFDYTPAADAGFIFTSYAKAVYFGRDHLEDDPDRERWFKEFQTKLVEQLPRATILVACMEDDQDHILGYSIILDKRLEFVYVKPLYRNQGIASFITNRLYDEINPDHITKIGQAILNKRNSAKENHGHE